MQKIAAVKVDSCDYRYEDVEREINEALTLLGGIDKFISPGERVLYYLKRILKFRDL